MLDEGEELLLGELVKRHRTTNVLSKTKVSKEELDAFMLGEEV